MYMTNYHLTRGTKHWILRNEKEYDILALNEIKEECIKQSVKYIKDNGGGSLKIHKEDGTFEEERTYLRSKDPKGSPG